MRKVMLYAQGIEEFRRGPVPPGTHVTALDTFHSFLEIPILRIEERRQGVIERIGRVFTASARKFFQLGLALGFERNGVHVSNLFLSYSSPSQTIAAL
jgi:hypothetical protein